MYPTRKHIYKKKRKLKYPTFYDNNNTTPDTIFNVFTNNVRYKDNNSVIFSFMLVFSIFIILFYYFGNADFEKFIGLDLSFTELKNLIFVNECDFINFSVNFKTSTGINISPVFLKILKF